MAKNLRYRRNEMKQISLGIIGCGGFVGYHVQSIMEDVPEFRIVALADTAHDHAQRLRKEFIPRRRVGIFADHREMLAEAQPEAVIVSTPHTLHYRHCRDSIAAGAHVMVEKPMVTDPTDARRLVAQCGRARKTLVVAVQGMFTDTFAYARKLLADGTIGPLQLVTGMLAQGWMAGTAGKWRQNPKLSGGGQLYDSSAHVISAMMYLVDNPVSKVFCWADDKGAGVDINAVATIRFENGVMATINSGGNCDTWYSHVVFQGENALMHISPHGGSFRVTGKKLKKDITAVPKRWAIRTVTPVRNFADCILGRTEPRCGGRLGILVSDLMDLLYKSVGTGKPAKAV
jgi:predicted dehydrogenase